MKIFLTLFLFAVPTLLYANPFRKTTDYDIGVPENTIAETRRHTLDEVRLPDIVVQDRKDSFGFFINFANSFRSSENAYFYEQSEFGVFLEQTEFNVRMKSRLYTTTSKYHDINIETTDINFISFNYINYENSFDINKSRLWLRFKRGKNIVEFEEGSDNNFRNRIDGMDFGFSTPLADSHLFVYSYSETSGGRLYRKHNFGYINKTFQNFSIYPSLYLQNTGRIHQNAGGELHLYYRVNNDLLYFSYDAPLENNINRPYNYWRTGWDRYITEYLKVNLSYGNSYQLSVDEIDYSAQIFSLKVQFRF